MDMQTRLGSVVLWCVVGVLMSTPAAQAGPEAICVPWEPSEPGIPHFTYSGAQITLKGIARGGATEYWWDFGDGGSTSWIAVADSYNLGVTHTYTGSVGQLFSATLHVKDASGQEDQCTYLTMIRESSDLSIPGHLQVRINGAIDEGLWWLHTNMIRSTYPGGTPGYGQAYGWWDVSGGADYDVPAVGTAVGAFQLHGHKVIGDYSGDPYVETVQRGMNYILCHTYDHAISSQTYGDPDTNGNGIGLFINYRDVWNCERSTYIGGICAITMGSSGAPNRIASVGGAYVYGRPYHEIVQDLVDYFAWGQNDSGSGRGGWRYYANYGNSDMSTTQWPVLAMMVAEETLPVGSAMGSTVPQFVRDELPHFLNYTRHDVCDSHYGGYGYSDASNHINCLKAAVGIICWEWLGTPLTDPNITGALGYLYRHWNDNGGSWQDQPIHGNSYGMYAVMKAMRIPQPDMYVIVDHNNPPSFCDDQPTGNTLEWYYATGSGSPQGAAQAYYQEGLAHYSVRKQHGDGSWDDTTGPNPVYDAFSTGWQILTLLKGIVRTPVAIICDCDEQEYDWNQDIHLDGSCSYHLDPNRTIVEWEWDLDNDGLFGTDDDDCFGEPSDGVGINATIVGGYPTTGIYPVALRVTDDNPGDPQTDIYVCDINVHPPPHCPHAFAHPVPEGNYIGWIGVPVQFDGSASWDPNDDIVSYEWDLDEDGLFGTDDSDCFGEPSDAVGITPQWTWDAPYEGVICLRVTDAGGEFDPCDDTDCRTVTIGNHPPVSDPNGPYFACPDCTTYLDGTGSYDPDPGDSISSYAWDLDNDGEFDDSLEPQPPFTVGPVVGTVYDVCLKVTDTFDEYDIACTTVEVVDLEACCEPNGMCYMADADSCLANGDTPKGPGTQCLGIQACCFDDGTCQMMDAICCLNEGGEPKGPGTLCLGWQACCFPDGTCTMMDAICCLNEGGEPKGPGTQCGGIEACCFGDGTCEMMDTICCLNQGGEPKGPDSECQGLWICCHPDGWCEEMDRICCWNAGGEKPIPTVSAWGLVIVTLVLLTGGKIYFGRRRAGMIST